MKEDLEKVGEYNKARREENQTDELGRTGIVRQEVCGQKGEEDGDGGGRPGSSLVIFVH